ncbi:MAG: hypothetical protein QOJ12_2460 [Thermoleophilales bacterium]|jgi:hypothetical protein|nr:hypothetical protein [Thermoleophilales bacterium]
MAALHTAAMSMPTMVIDDEVLGQSSELTNGCSSNIELSCSSKSRSQSGHRVPKVRLTPPQCGQS